MQQQKPTKCAASQFLIRILDNLVIWNVSVCVCVYVSQLNFSRLCTVMVADCSVKTAANKSSDSHSQPKIFRFFLAKKSLVPTTIPFKIDTFSHYTISFLNDFCLGRFSFSFLLTVWLLFVLYYAPALLFFLSLSPSMDYLQIRLRFQQILLEKYQRLGFQQILWAKSHLVMKKIIELNLSVVCATSTIC